MYFERMRGRLVNQKGKIVSMFRTWKELSKKGKGYCNLASEVFEAP